MCVLGGGVEDLSWSFLYIFLINVGSLGINPNVWKKSNKIVPYRISKKEFSRPAILLCEQLKKIQLTRVTLHNWADDAELLLNPVIVSRNEKERVLIEPSINSVCLLYSSSIPPPQPPVPWLCFDSLFCLPKKSCSLCCGSLRMWNMLWSWWYYLVSKTSWQKLIFFFSTTSKTLN